MSTWLSGKGMAGILTILLSNNKTFYRHNMTIKKNTHVNALEINLAEVIK